MSRLEEVHKAAVKAEQERLDREAIEHLDWPVCSFENPGMGERCTEEAVYVSTCTHGCGARSHVCDEHRRWMLDYDALMRCRRCKALGAARDICLFLKLGRRP